MIDFQAKYSLKEVEVELRKLKPREKRQYCIYKYTVAMITMICFLIAGAFTIKYTDYYGCKAVWKRNLVYLIEIIIVALFFALTTILFFWQAYHRQYAQFIDHWKSYVVQALGMTVVIVLNIAYILTDGLEKCADHKGKNHFVTSEYQWMMVV